MKKKIYIALILIIILVAVLLFSRKPKEETELGKLQRPPKIRIVYSKKQKDKDRPKIGSSDDVVKLFRELWSSQIEVREEFIVLLLDRSNRVLGYQLLSKGGTTGTIADLKLIFSVALEALASAIIIAHNHPSGSLKPSTADIKLTKRINEVGKQLDIPLFDHIILTKESYYSFADEGDLF